MFKVRKYTIVEIEDFFVLLCFLFFRLPVHPYSASQSHLQDLVKAMRGMSGIRHEQKPRMTEIIV